MNAPETRGTAQEVQSRVAANDERDLAPSPETNQSIVVLPVPGDLESIPSHPPSGAPLSEDAARTLTDIIRRDTQSLWQMLLRAYEGNAHGALGYTSWPAYCAAEIQIGRARSYQILDAARVANEVQSTIVDSGVVPPILTEAVARELVTKLGEPGELRETYAEAVETAPRNAAGVPKVTARHVAEVVASRQPPREIASTVLRDAEPSSRPPRPKTRTVTSTVRKVVETIKAEASTEDIIKTVNIARSAVDMRGKGTAQVTLANALRDVLMVLHDLYEPRP